MCRFFSYEAELAITIHVDKLPLPSVIEDSHTSKPAAVAVTSAFSVMMSSSQSRRYKGFPVPYKDPKTGEERLHNKLIQVWRDDEKISFRNLTERTVDENWRTMRNVIWDLNKYRPTLSQLEPRVNDLLQKFLGFSHLDDKQKSKKSRPLLRQQTLDLWINQLEQLVQGHFAKCGMNFFFENLKRSVADKKEKFRDEAQRVQAYRVSGSYKAEWKTFSIGEISASEIKIATIEPSFGNEKAERYSSLNKALAESIEFEPIIVAEHMAPHFLINKKNQFFFVQNIQVGNRSILVKVLHSGNHPSDIWIFKTGNDKQFLKSDEYQNKLLATAKKCERRSNFYAQKWIKMAFNCRLASIYPIAGCNLIRQFCWRFLGDASSENADFKENKKGLVSIALQIGDSELIEDARKLNGRPINEAFNDFWLMTEEYLNDVADAAHARRHGDQGVGYMSEILSSTIMHDTITNMLKEKL